MEQQRISDNGEDYEFAFSIESDPGALPEITADDIFYNGRILPVYPLFNRDLMAGGGGGGGDASAEEEKLAGALDRFSLSYPKPDLRSGSASSSSSISSEVEDLIRARRTAPAYFSSVPRSAPQSPDRWRKSSSTGTSASASKRWRLRDLMVGRSRSDGKEKFVVVPPADEHETQEREMRYFVSPKPDTNSAAAAAAKQKKGIRSKKGKGGAVKEMDIVTAHRIYYGKGGADGVPAPAGGNSRRSFLPYRQELLGGILGNAKHHPL
ncbi:hypothetical protein AXF42_Ash011348 [Apostasia shenzhenica]|uniref:Uncharacterized protein n=1 Tax=Apostasia shenzhenica TaxID=1088818 RepID=A0A2I0AEA0_9ASPA|nr:hypothetical protein AXF42_Ash011348 [Apostasia shenzhenica]